MRLLVLVVGLFLATLAVGAYDSAEVTGRVDATEQESGEGYFAIGADTMIVVKPGSDMHAWLKQQNKGQDCGWN